MDDSSSWEHWLTIFMLGVLPWIFVAVGAGLIWKAHSFMKSAIRLTGTVTGVYESTSYNSDRNTYVTTYQPVFEFTLPDGRVAEGKTFISGTGRNFPVGTQKEVLVDPENTGTVRLPGFLIYGFGAIFLGIGLVFAVVGIFALRAM